MHRKLIGAAAFSLMAIITGAWALEQRADVQIAQGQPPAANQPAPTTLRPEMLTIYDCRREIELVAGYWDRLGGLRGINLDRRFLDAAIRAFQAGNIPECWRTIGELRRHMGIQ